MEFIHSLWHRIVKTRFQWFFFFEKWYLTNYQPSMDILTIYHSMDAPNKNVSMTQRHTVFSLLHAIGSIQAAPLQLLADQLALLQNLPKVVRLILQVGANVVDCVIVTAQTGGCRGLIRGHLFWLTVADSCGICRLLVCHPGKSASQKWVELEPKVLYHFGLWQNMANMADYAWLCIPPWSGLQFLDVFIAHRFQSLHELTVFDKSHASGFDISRGPSFFPNIRFSYTIYMFRSRCLFWRNLATVSQIKDPVTLICDSGLHHQRQWIAYQI